MPISPALGPYPPETDGYNDYNDYSQDSNFSYESGLVAIPLASATPAVRVVRLHGGFGLRQLDFNSARQGRPPIIPPMADTVNDTFLSGNVAFALPTASQQAAGYNWAVSGTYEYIQLEPRVVGIDTFPVGGYPAPMQTVDMAAFTLGGNSVIPPYAPVSVADFNTFWSNFEPSIAQISSGNWTWPFLAFPPAFTSTTLLSN